MSLAASFSPSFYNPLENPKMPSRDPASAHRCFSPSAAPDFIEGYTDYADVFELPKMLHEAVAIQLVASVLNRNRVSFNNGAVPYSLDLWTLMLSSSGMGRGTVLGVASSVLEAADLRDLETPTQWGSREALFQELAENPHALFFWGEFAERLRQMNDPRFTGLKEWLTDRYDNLRIPPNVRYRRRGAENDTPPIVFRESPRINILATSSEDWLFTHLEMTDSTGGFLPRFLLVRVSGEERDIAIPKELDDSKLPALAAKLREIDALRGPADISGIEAEYKRWYSVAKQRFRKQPNHLLADAYWNRHRGHILKLAVVFQASEFANLQVGARAWERAVEFSNRIESCIFELLETGMSAQGYALQKAEDLIRKAGRGGLAHNLYTRAFQGLSSKQRDEQLQTLIDMGRVLRKEEGSGTYGGRPKTVYVHIDHLKVSSRKGPEGTLTKLDSDA